ncbi:hypothetical protein D3C83_276240 [compost metagenome]
MTDPDRVTGRSVAKLPDRGGRHLSDERARSAGRDQAIHHAAFRAPACRVPGGLAAADPQLH